MAGWAVFERGAAGSFSLFSGSAALARANRCLRLPLGSLPPQQTQDVSNKECKMATKPLIGVNLDYRASRKDSPAFSFLHAGYCNALMKSGATPLLIPHLVDESDMQRVLDLLDGMLFVGGADLDCRNDGYMLHPSMRLLDRRREDFDRQMMGLVAERRMPVMGIGCGLQLLNVSQGGNLFLHISEDLPKALPHLDAMDPNHRHALQIEMGTIMERVYGEGEIRVNSMHHMAIDAVAPGFAVTARCPDGVVEAIESTTDWFAFGTQFHPESESASALDLRIFEEFVVGITGEVLEEMRLVA
jgi:putative glutamine amidotransferase